MPGPNGTTASATARAALAKTRCRKDRGDPSTLIRLLSSQSLPVQYRSGSAVAKGISQRIVERVGAARCRPIHGYFVAAAVLTGVRSHAFGAGRNDEWAKQGFSTAL